MAYLIDQYMFWNQYQNHMGVEHVESINSRSPLAGGFIKEHPIQMDDLGVPPWIVNLHIKIIAQKLHIYFEKPSS